MAKAQGIEVKVDARQLLRVQAEMDALPRGADKVLYRALNKVIAATRTDVTRRVAGEINITQSEVRKRNLSMRKASLRRLTAGLTILGARIPLVHFRSRQTAKGVRAKIKRRGAAKLYEETFQESPGPRPWGRRAGKSGRPTTMPSGHQGVFKRTGTPRISRSLSRRSSKKLGRKKGVAFITRPRLPITELRGPSVPAVVENIREYARAALESRLGQKLFAEIENQIGVLLAQRKAAGNA